MPKETCKHCGVDLSLKQKYEELKVEYTKRALLEITNSHLVRENAELSLELEKITVQNKALRIKNKQTRKWNRS